MSIGQQLLDVPMGEMISSLGISIAEAQKNLDENSIEILKTMGEEGTVSLPFVSVKYDGEKMLLDDDEVTTSMIGAGFQPTFYQFSETIIEVKIAISTSYESSYERTTQIKTDIKNKKKKKTVTRATTVDATYSNKYNYSAEGSSLLRTRLVPVPPNPIVSQMIEMRNQAMQKFFELEFEKCEKQIAEAEMQLTAAKATTSDQINNNQTT